MMMRWIKMAFVSRLIKDDTKWPRAQVNYNGVTIDAYRFSPYGISSHPPLDTLATLLSVNGHRDNLVALIADPLKRAKNLEPGEVQVGNRVTGSFVKFNKDQGVDWFVNDGGDLVVTLAGGNASIDVTGDINVDATGNVNITAPTVAITGNLTVSGTITAIGEVIGATKALSTHTHNENGTGGGVTGPPN